MDRFADRFATNDRRLTVRVRSHLGEAEVRELRSIVIEFDEQERRDGPIAGR